MTLQVSIFPNPFDLLIDLEVIIPVNLPTIVRILDHRHNIIKMMSWSLKQGTNKTSFPDLADLPAGNYIVDISNLQGENLYNTRLLKIS